MSKNYLIVREILQVIFQHNPAPDEDWDGFCKLEALMLAHGCTFCTVKRIKAEFAKGTQDSRDYREKK